jgi:hypothetical protein
MTDYTTGDTITVYNRVARVRKTLASHIYVQWQDNNTMGIVPRGEL